MSDTNAQEPTMEEILASIRRIISEDDAPASAEEETPPAAVEAAPEPEPEPQSEAPPPPPPPEDDVLELTQPLQSAEPEPPAPPTPQTLGDLDVSSSPSPAPPPPTAREPLVSAPAAEAAASHFGQLSRSVLAPSEGRTLDDVVEALLRPLLKDWLDRHLAGIVEARVQAEVERISRSQAL